MCYLAHSASAPCTIVILAGMRKGSFFITMTKRLPSSEFEILEYEMYRMSWGEATVFIMQKVTECNEDVEDLSDGEDHKLDGDESGGEEEGKARLGGAVDEEDED
jgi:hypothetical protein